MSSPTFTPDSQGPFFNDRWVNSFGNGGTTALTPGTCVKVIGNQSVTACSATTDTLLGVVWNTTPPGALIGVVCRGWVYVTSDNSVTAGDLLVAGNAGQVHSIGATITANSNGTGTSSVVMVRGQAYQTQATTGQLFLAALY